MMRLEDLGTVVETDVLIIGGGIAGLFAAITAKDTEPTLEVLLVDKCQPGASGASAYAAGVLNFWQPGDSFEDYVEDIIVNNSEYLIDQDYTEQAVRQSYDRFCELADFGAEYQKDEKGQAIRIPVIGTAYGKGTPYTGGTQLTWKCRTEAARRGVRLMDRMFVVDLLVTEGICVGAVGFHVRSGEFFIFKARATVLANGTVFFGRRPQMGPSGTTGDGPAMAYRAGVPIRNAEQQWATHGPAAFDSSGVHVIFGCGGILVNSKGERFMEGYSPRLLEESRRYEVSRAILQEWREGRGPCYLDCTHLPSERIGYIYTALPRLPLALGPLGLDLARDRIEWVPYGLSFQSTGGIKIKNGDGQVDMQGLWAVGNACDFCGGADSTAVTAMIGSANIGARAGTRAAEYCGDARPRALEVEQVQKLRNSIFQSLEVKSTPDTDSDKATSRLAEVMMRYVNLIKDEPMLKRAIEEIDTLKAQFGDGAAKDAHGLMNVHGARNKIQLAEIVARSALLRTESRACHYRLDYPSRDDRNWLKWVVAQHVDGEGKVWAEDIPLAKWKYRPALA